MSSIAEELTRSRRWGRAAAGTCRGADPGSDIPAGPGGAHARWNDGGEGRRGDASRAGAPPPRWTGAGPAIRRAHGLDHLGRRPILRLVPPVITAPQSSPAHL